MKKLMMTLIAISLAVASCSKEGQDCYWTDQSGNDYTTYPTPAQIEQIKQTCSCTPTFTKHCE